MEMLIYVSTLIIVFFFIVFLGLLFWSITIYNSLVKQRILVNEGWSSIDVQLLRRMNLIPNLVSAVKGYMKHEAEGLEDIVKIRAGKDTDDLKIRGDQEQKIGQAMFGIMAVAEDYPDLKADKNFQDLQKELSELENAIQMSRRYYNGTVRDYNTTCAVFPNVIIAKAFNFSQAVFFELDDPDRKRKLPAVDFKRG